MIFKSSKKRDIFFTSENVIKKTQMNRLLCDVLKLRFSLIRWFRWCQKFNKNVCMMADLALPHRKLNVMLIRASLLNYHILVWLFLEKEHNEPLDSNFKLRLWSSGDEFMAMDILDTSFKYDEQCDFDC